MEVDNQHTEELTKMETLKKKGGENEEIEFDKIKVSDLAASKRDEYRKIPVPRHRMTPLRSNWDSILKTLVEHMKLQVRMNTKRHAIELKVSYQNQKSISKLLLLPTFRHQKSPKMLVLFRRGLTSSNASCLASTCKTPLLCFVWTTYTLRVSRSRMSKRSTVIT